MRDIQRIRLHNLRFLLQEAEQLHGGSRGAQSFLANASNVKPSLLSMLLHQAVHSDTGKRRQLGDETASRLEEGMGKPPGWLDVDRSAARDFREAAMLDKLRKISSEQRQALERMLDAFLPAGGKDEPDSDATNKGNP